MEMLIEVDAEVYRRIFPSSPHPFISEPFIELNKGKAEKILRLVEDRKKPGMGLIAGVREKTLYSPFSAPFGGFHFRKSILYSSEIDGFLSFLKEYIITHGLDGIELTLPPDLYQSTINAKAVNSLIRMGFRNHIPDITSWIKLEEFQGSFSHRGSNESYRKALRNGLSFRNTTDSNERKEVYDLIARNRARFGRPIFMTFDDVLNASELWRTDFFVVTAADHSILASGIFYRSFRDIIYALFWGDNEKGRNLNAMDFLSYKLWSFYKDLGYKYIDLGISTESGIPNNGLLRFKENHNAVSSIRHTFSWRTDH